MTKIDPSTVLDRLVNGRPERDLPQFVYRKGRAGYLYFVRARDGICLRMPGALGSPEFQQAYENFMLAYGPRPKRKPRKKKGAVKGRKLLPSAKDLRRLFAYNEAEGHLRWRDDGALAAAPSGDERYLEVWFMGHRWMEHRIIWKMLTGEEPEVIDHISGDRQDNRPVNLRSVNQALNSRNRAVPKSPHGAHGVFPYKGGERWKAQVGRRHIGIFDTKEEAMEARRIAADALGYHENHGRQAQ